MEWISVNEDYPNLGPSDPGVYITCDSDGFVYGASHYFDKCEDFKQGFYTMVYGEWQLNAEVTHWMPLPEPPKQEL